MINNIVDKVFCITTVNSDRREYIQSHLTDKKIDFEFFIAPIYEIISPCIKLKDYGAECRPALSLLSAYTSVIEYAYVNNLKSIMILEDDCHFTNGWEEKTNRFFNELLNLTEWDIINLGYHLINSKKAREEIASEYVLKPKQWHCSTHCMILKNSIFKQFIEINRSKNYSLPTDYVFMEMYEDKNITSYIPREEIVYQMSFRQNHNGFPNRDELKNVNTFPSLIL